MQDIRATAIPAAGIIVSLVGTFAFMKIAGFSINLLTLFALVLVIGTVVDDSIVVVEAVKAKFESGSKTAYEASVNAMKGLGATLFTTSLVFMMIFIPVAFTGGTTGVFFKQFGLTMAVAVGISLINALTLSPALCALMLRPQGSTGKVAEKVKDIYESSFSAVKKHYEDKVAFFTQKRMLVPVLVIVAAVLAAVLFKMVPTGFVPSEDTGTLSLEITAPSGYSMDKTAGIMNSVCDKIMEMPVVESVGGVVGVGAGSNGAFIYVQLTPWSERKGSENSLKSIAAQLEEMLAEETEAQSFVMEPTMIEGYGGGGGFEFSVQDKNGGDIRELKRITDQFCEHLSEQPGISDVYSNFDVNYPQYRVDVDVARCKKSGVAPSEVLNTLGGYLGGDYISNFNKFNKVYQITSQLKPEDRARPDALEKLFVRSEKGELLPVSQFITLTKEYMPQSLSSLNMFSCIGVSGSVDEDGSTGGAISVIKQLAATQLPVGYAVEFSGITREEAQSGNTGTYIFITSILFVYLVMVALYESLLIPLAVMLSVPFGIVGSLISAKIFGIENNIYMQIGLIMLIGLLAKTAILITEYAAVCRQSGQTIFQSAFTSAKMRLRPILMTSLTMIFGMLPLMFATGAGANGSRTIGFCIVGGMLFGTLGLLFAVPKLFCIFQELEEKLKKRKQ